jgi:anti-sigma-K factor RskA
MTDRDHVLELTAAYALGALPADQKREVELHCASCAACAGDLEEMSGLTATLPLACDQLAPPGDLKRRIVAAARADVSAGEILRVPNRRPSAQAASWWAAAAAAVFVAGAAVGTSAFVDHQRMAAKMAAMHGELDANRTAIADIAEGRVWDMSGGTKSHWWHCTLVQPPKQQQPMLIALMPPAPKDMTFQAWIIRHGKAHSAGMLPAGATTMMHMSMPVEKGDVVAFSIEPMGGSLTPTMPFAMEQRLD